MTKRAIKSQLNEAKLLLERNANDKNLLKQNEPLYNVSQALYHIVEALAGIADETDTIESRVSRR